MRNWSCALPAMSGPGGPRSGERVSASFRRFPPLRVLIEKGPYFLRIRGFRPSRPFRRSFFVSGIGGGQQGRVDLPAARRPAAQHGEDEQLGPQRPGGAKTLEDALGAGGVEGAAERAAPHI